MQESFFIPQRKRKVSDAVVTEKTKKPRCHYVDGVLIFDEQTSRHEVSTTTTEPDIDFAYAPSLDALEKKKENAVKSALWAINMYLEPDNVMHSTIYWLWQYVNYKLPESAWFNDHIQGLMTNPVQLSMTSSQGIAHIHAKLPKYTLLLHVAGSNLHKIPSEYFVHKDCVQILECLAHLLEPSNECFLTRNTFGLKGEVELTTFQYNRILSYFYEPSFLIITSYLVYVHQLLALPNGTQLSSFLPRIKNITKPIHHKQIPWDRLLCLNKANSNYAEKRAVFEQDLIDLKHELSHLQVVQVVDGLTALWSKKATYVTDQIDKRFNAIYTQIY